MQVVDIWKVEGQKACRIPLMSCLVPAGSPYLPDDNVEELVDLNEEMILHPGETYLVRVVGDSMINANLVAGDVLIVDRVLEPRDRSIVVALVEGELTVKRLRIVEKKKFLMPENEDYPMIRIGEGVVHWGVVTQSYRKHIF